MYYFWDTVIQPVLEILQPKTIVEIGSDQGHNTENLLEYCQQQNAKLHVIDPWPKYEISDWEEEYGESVVFHLSLSLNALPLVEQCDLVLIDGDHNWYTVFNELKLIEKLSDKQSQPFPLILLHDIGWPYGRRDLYYLHLVEEAMKRIIGEYKGEVILDVIGAVPKSYSQKWFNVVSIPKRVSSNYPEFVQWLCRECCWSIGIAPLENTEFNRCKSYIKYLDYSALG